MFRLMAFAVAVSGLCLGSSARADDAEDKAVAFVEKLGGKVYRDEKAPGNLVNAVILQRTKVTDAGLKELATLKSLTALDLSSTKVTDAGVKELATITTLTAKAASNSTFTGWTGDCVGAQASCTFTISGENNVTANFDAAAPGGGGGGGGGASSFKISIGKNGNGAVTTDPAAQSFAPGTVVTLTATPGAGQPWIGWGGACAGTSLTCALTMDANKSVTANFR